MLRLPETVAQSLRKAMLLKRPSDPGFVYLNQEAHPLTLAFMFQ